MGREPSIYEQQQLRMRQAQMQAASGPMLQGMLGMAGVLSFGMGAMFGLQNRPTEKYTEEYTPTDEELESEQKLIEWVKDPASEYR